MAADAGDLLRTLRDRLRSDGLHIVLPLGEREMQAAGAELREVAPFARSGVLIGDGGGEFFGFFLGQLPGQRRTEGEHPLDAFTRVQVGRAVAEVVEGRFEVRFPFATERVHLPFQRLGEAAGLPPPGPLGVQVHPRFGPWWAYRALVVLETPLEREVAVAESCATCRGPCVNDCGAHGAAVRFRDGVRLGPIACGDDCGARLRCPVGAGARYSAEQIAFHARARRSAASARDA